jgi:hypothetical protein
MTERREVKLWAYVTVLQAQLEGRSLLSRHGRRTHAAPTWMREVRLVEPGACRPIHLDESAYFRWPHTITAGLFATFGRGVLAAGATGQPHWNRARASGGYDFERTASTSSRGRLHTGD